MDDQALPSPRAEDEPVAVAMLHAGIPLSLLLDLSSGPHSEELYLLESVHAG